MALVEPPRARLKKSCVCVCVCVCVVCVVCVCVLCVCACACVCVCVRVRVCVCLSLSLSVCVCVCVCLHACMCVCLGVYVCVYACMCVCALSSRAHEPQPSRSLPISNPPAHLLPTSSRAASRSSLGLKKSWPSAPKLARSGSGRRSSFSRHCTHRRTRRAAKAPSSGMQTSPDLPI